MMETGIERTAPRISVLDANEVDSVIFQVFKSQVDYISKSLPPWFLNNFGPEINAILKYGIWKVSVGKSKATFGQQLLHLRYSKDSQFRKLQILALLTIGGPYVKERIFSIISRNHHGLKRIDSLIDGMSTLINMLNIVTFINFLRKGGSSTFLEYFLNLTPVSTVLPSKRNVGYVYMTRELIWHGFIELLVIIIPFINYSKLKRKVVNMIKGKITTHPASARCSFSTSSKCPVCREPPILPHQMGCSHSFCFYCLATNREADRAFECPECGFSNQDISALKPVQTFV